MSQRQGKDQVVEQATVGCDETAPPPTTTLSLPQAEEESKWEDLHEPKEVVSADDDEKVIVDEINVDDYIEDSNVPPSRPPQPHRDDDDDDLRHIKGARSRLELAPAVFKGDEDRMPDDETSKEKKTNDDKFEDGPKDYHQRTFRAVRAANMLLPDEESEDEEEEDEEDRPGAIPVRGIGRSGMGPSPDEEEVTIAYSMGGPNNGETAAEQDSGNALPSRTDEGNENLVEAVLAPEPPEIVVATPMEEEEDTHQETHHNRRRTYLLVAVISIAAVLALSLTLSDNGKGAEPTTSTTSTTAPTTAAPIDAPTVSPSTAPTVSPSTAPTVSPSTAPTNNKADTAISMLTPYIPDIPNSPMQLWALDWLINNDDGLIDAQDADRLLDRYVLAIFYNATTIGDGWDENTGWLSEVSTCAWDIDNGSLCPQIDGRAERIDLFNNNLQGYIPTEIGALSTLTYIRLRRNNIQGTLPTEIGSLTALTYLSLYNNDIQGSIPTEIGMLTELTYLDFGENELVGTIPTELGQLTELTYLYLELNELVGTIPTELGQLTELRTLDLGSNDLTGTVPTELDSILSSLDSISCRLGCNDGLVGMPYYCDRCR